jgi:hypothetical protein
MWQLIPHGNWLRQYLSAGISDLVSHSPPHCFLRNYLFGGMPQGDDAYRQDLYGPEIIVERVIRANGSTSYKLMNGTTKKKVADKARELTAIVDQFDIQVDNPIAILSQEESKRFLKSKDPKDM